MGKKLLKTHKVSFQEEGTEFKWYPVVTSYGHERKVAQMMQKRFENLGAADKFKEVFVPIVEWEEKIQGRVKKDGTFSMRNVKKSENLLESGYIFIQMIMTDQTWNIVRQTTGVAGWLSRQGRPQETSDVEVLKLKKIVNAKTEEHETGKITTKHFDGKVGDVVKITSGPFLGYECEVENIQETAVSLIMLENGAKIEISPLDIEVI